MKGILICGELKGGNITSVSKELVTTGRRLGDTLDQPLYFLLMGDNLGNITGKAADLGVDKVLAVENPALADLNPERLTAVLKDICDRIEPQLILFGQTDMGRDVAPRLAAKLGASVCTDCVDLAFNEAGDMLLQTKPVYGGNAMAQWASPNRFPHVVTMRPRSEKPADPDPTNPGEIESVAVEIDETQTRARLITTIQEENGEIRLEDAKIIVAGGGGIGGSEGFRLVRELAQSLGAAVGITRVPSDENWMPKKLEIGQTGHTVSPSLYIAIGISGAPQHLAGCSSSKVIVAINRDPQARIFDEADFGIAADYKQVLPSLIEKIKTLKE